MLSILAARYGLSRELDVILFAFTIPQLLGELATEVLYSSLLPRLSALRAERAEEAWALCNRALNSAFLLLAGLSAIVWVSSGLLVRLLGFGFAGDDARLAVALLQAGAVMPLLYSFTSPAQAWLMAEGRVLAPSLKWSVGGVVSLLALIALLRADTGPAAYIYAYLVGSAAASAVVLVAHARGERRFGYRILALLSTAEWRLLIRQMAPQLGVGLVPRAVRLGERSVAAGLGPGAVAAITMARSISGLALMAVNALALGLFPALSRNAARGAEQLARHLRRGLACSLWGSVPMLVFLGVQRVPLIRVLFARRAFGPEEVARVAALVPWLLLAAGGVGIASIMVRGLYAQERSGQAAAVYLGALALYLPLLWVLTQSMGIHGVAAASAVLGALLLVGLVGRYRSLLAGTAGEWLARSAKLGAAAAVTAGVCFGWGALFPPAGLQSLWAVTVLSLGAPLLLSVGSVVVLARVLYPGEAQELLSLRRSSNSSGQEGSDA
jgi:putative peptidoglycan lipid II flippase